MLDLSGNPRNSVSACIYHKKHTPPQETTITVSPDVIAALAEAIAAIGQPVFADKVAACLRLVTPYSFTVMFGYRGTAQPLDLFDDFPETKRKVFVGDYQAGPYLLDPFFLAATRPVAPGLYRMRDLAPDRFYQGEYFRNYYVQTGLAEEIGIFTDTGDEAVVVVSLMRADKPYAPRELRALEVIRPAIQACIRRHWADLGRRFEPDGTGPGDGFDRRIAQSLQSFGAGILTAREREVAEYTLKGHSAEAVGRALGIASGTVRIHRRNIYAKLRINSQGELFSRFIGTLETRRR